MEPQLEEIAPAPVVPKPRRKRKAKAVVPQEFELTDVATEPHRITHPSREVKDVDLRGAIKPLELTKEKLLFLTDYTINVIGKWNDIIRDTPPMEMAARLVQAAPTSFELGQWQGVVSFMPVYPGHDAMIHVSVWDPLFMRRPMLARALIRHAMKKWNLRRVYACIPEQHTKANILCAKVGMTLEGRLRHAFVYNGTPVTGMYWGILAGEV